MPSHLLVCGKSPRVVYVHCPLEENYVECLEAYPHLKQKEVGFLALVVEGLEAWLWLIGPGFIYSSWSISSFRRKLRRSRSIIWLRISKPFKEAYTLTWSRATLPLSPLCIPFSHCYIELC